MLYNLSKGGIIMSFENKGYIPQFLGDDGRIEKKKKQEEKFLNMVGVLYCTVFFVILFSLVVCAKIINL